MGGRKEASLLTIPNADVIDRLLQNPRVALYLGGFILLMGVVYNFDKLTVPWRRQRHWENELSRLEANRKYWELQAYKKEHGFTEGQDLFPDQPKKTGVGRSPDGRLTPGQRFGYSWLGGYLGFLMLYSASLATSPAGASEQSFWGTALALAFLALISGLLTSSLKRVPDQRSRLIAAGALNALTVLVVFVLLVIPLLLMMA